MKKTNIVLSALVLLLLGSLFLLKKQLDFYKKDSQIERHNVLELSALKLDSTLDIKLDLVKEQYKEELTRIAEEYDLKLKRIQQVQTRTHSYQKDTVVYVPTQAVVPVDSSRYRLPYIAKIDGIQIQGYISSRDSTSSNIITRAEYYAKEERIYYLGQRSRKFLFFRVGPRELKEIIKTSGGKTTVNTISIYKNNRKRLEDKY